MLWKKTILSLLLLGYVPTPWEGRFEDYEEKGGMHIPLRGEVVWILDGTPAPYWKGRILEAHFEFTPPL